MHLTSYRTRLVVMSRGIHNQPMKTPLIISKLCHSSLTLFVILCVWWCPTHNVLCFCFVYLMLPVSIYWLFLIAPAVFSNVYLHYCIINAYFSPLIGCFSHMYSYQKFRIFIWIWSPIGFCLDVKWRGYIIFSYHAVCDFSIPSCSENIKKNISFTTMN